VPTLFPEGLAITISTRPLPTSFSVALGLCFILPLLNYFREPPIGDFFGEWASAVVMAVGALFMVRALPRRLSVSGMLFVVPVVLVALILLQASLGWYAYPQSPFFHFCYLAMAVLVVLLGQHFRSDGMAVEVTRRMAWAMVLVGLVNVAAQIAQLGRWDLQLQPWIVRLPDDSLCSPYGNTGQRNQTSAIAWLALLGTMYLTHERRMPRWLMPLLVALFLFSSALTISRTAWLFLVLTATGLLAVRTRWTGSFKGRLLIAGGLIAAFAIVTVGTSALMEAIDPSCKSSVARLAEGQASVGIAARLDFLRQAFLVWMHSPWIGVGAGGFKGMAYQLIADARSQPLDTYAHNIVAQLLAEFGVIGAAGLLLVAGACLLAVWRNRHELGAADALLLGWLAVLGAYSLLEFPLWYVHFLIFFGLALGLLIRPQWRLLPLQVPARWLAGGLSAVALATCAVVLNDYLNLSRLMYLVTLKVEGRVASSPYVDKLLADADAKVVIYRVHAEHMLGIGMSMTRDKLEEKIEATDRLLARMPVAPTIARRAVLAVLANDAATARHHLYRLLQVHPYKADELIEQMRTMARERPQELGALDGLIDEAVANAPKRGG